MSDRAIVIDCETTGNDPLEVIELCAVEVGIISGSEKLVVSQRYKPKHAITFGAMATHHILLEDLAECDPASEAVVPDGYEYIIGHNVDYDWSALGSPNVKRICTLALARSVWPELDCHKLGAILYKVCGVSARKMLVNAHSAAVDVAATTAILFHLIEAAGLDSWEAVWQLSEAARVPTHFTFGKHKGLLIKDAPSDYKAWLMRQADVDAYLMQALRA